jgi:hypothetical protein
MNAAEREAETIEKARQAAEEREKLKRQADKIAFEVAQQQRVKAREVQKNPRNLNDKLNEVKLVLEIFESKRVLSYRVESHAGGITVVSIAFPNGPPTRITIDPDKVRVEKVGMDERKVTVEDPKISEVGHLTEQNMVELIETLAGEWIDSERGQGLWDVFEKET